MIPLFESVEERDKTAAIKKIIEQASPRRDFSLLVGLSVAMASLGVIVDSTVVLVGSMLIAPILYPLLSLALGITTADKKLTTSSLVTLGRISIIAIVVGIVVGVASSSEYLDTFGVVGSLAFSGPSLAYAVIAGISGFAAAFALVKPTLSEMLPGVAIAASLVPPLAIVGVGIGMLEFNIAVNALLLYIVNVIGIVVSAMFVFTMLQLSRKQKIVSAEVEKSEELVAAEKEG